jgi:hypothetical protein
VGIQGLPQSVPYPDLTVCFEMCHSTVELFSIQGGAVCSQALTGQKMVLYNGGRHAYNLWISRTQIIGRASVARSSG